MHSWHIRFVVELLTIQKISKVSYLEGHLSHWYHPFHHDLVVQEDTADISNHQMGCCQQFLVLIVSLQAISPVKIGASLTELNDSDYKSYRNPRIHCL